MYFTYLTSNLSPPDQSLLKTQTLPNALGGMKNNGEFGNNFLKGISPHITFDDIQLIKKYTVKRVSHQNNFSTFIPIIRVLATLTRRRCLRSTTSSVVEYMNMMPDE